MDHRGDMEHRTVRTGPKSMRIESSQEVNARYVKARSDAVDQSPVAHNQAETSFRSDFHFKLLNTKAFFPYPPINVELSRALNKHLNLFIVCNGRRVTELFQNDPTRKEATHRSLFQPYITRNVQWSPKGTYLLEICRRAIGLFGGNEYSDLLPMIMTYRHEKVERVDFSPGEKYMVSYSKLDPSKTQEHWLKIFDVSSGRLVTGLDGYVAADSPVIRWAGGEDDKYFATLSKNNVYVYETETFKLLGNKPVDVDDDVVDISWSPTGSILTLWKRSDVTKIVLVRIPDKKFLIQKDITVNPNASSDCKMFWQTNGKCLAVQVDRHTYSVFELFCFKEDDIITTESLEVDGKFIAFAWEPRGHRFAVIHGEQSKPRVSFYAMETGKFLMLATFEDKQADTLFWSPRGKNIVLADLKEGSLEFFNVDELLTMKAVKHKMVTVIAWDPTGRYVATTVTISREISLASDPDIDGIDMWSFRGDHLYSVPSGLEDWNYRLLQLEWRPIDDEKMLEKCLLEEDSECPASD